jgi:hypothetical protein
LRRATSEMWIEGFTKLLNKMKDGKLGTNFYCLI